MPTYYTQILQTRKIANISIYSFLFTYSLTHSMEQSPSWKANWFSDNQEIFHILWNPKVHYRLYNSLPPVAILNQINPVHGRHITSWRSISILTSHLRLGLPSGVVPSGFPTKTLYTPLLFPIRATYISHLILLYLIISTPLLPRPPQPRYSPQHPILKHDRPTFLLQCERPSFKPKRNIYFWNIVKC